MYWKLSATTPVEKRECFEPQGRFVLHRHLDAEGPHLDLRLESNGCAVGYRIGGTQLEDGAWATEKLPHPVGWLEQDGDAVREDDGLYTVLQRDADSCELELRGSQGLRVVRFEREAALDAASAREVALALRDTASHATQAGALLRDGVFARRRLVERFCTLGRELDAAAFDETRWRRLLAGMPLEEMQSHLRAYETRFDAKYPPQPVSQPEALDGTDSFERAMELVRGR
jgi:hypothetical protein